MNSAKATSFATFKDLVGYIDCLLAGGSETHCYAKGDNGRGAWGDVTAQLTRPMVAISKDEMEAKFGEGNHGMARGKWVEVTLIGRGHENTFSAQVYDIAPDGVVDLNPASLIAAGLPADTELACNCEWKWV